MIWATHAGQSVSKNDCFLRQPTHPLPCLPRAAAGLCGALFHDVLKLFVHGFELIASIRVNHQLVQPQFNQIHHTVRGFLKIHLSNPRKLLNEWHLRQQGAKYLLLVRPRCGHPEGWFLPLRLWAVAVLPAVLMAFHRTLSLRGGPRVHICGPGSVSSSQPWRTTGKAGARPETPRLLRCNAVLRHQSTLWEECQASRPGATRPEAAPDQRTAINSSC